MSQAARSVIVMMDTRPAFAHARASPQYPQLAVALNRLYACAHGYDLLSLRMRRPVCHHGPHERHPSYCKLVAVAEARSRGYGLVEFETLEGAQAALSLNDVMTDDRPMLVRYERVQPAY